MKTIGKPGRSWFLAIAKAVAVELKPVARGTPLRIRIPRRATNTNTNGWAATIGDLGRGKPRLEIWFDRFSGHPDRKLYACLHSASRAPLVAITKHASRHFWPARVVTQADTEETTFMTLSERLSRSDFNSPILEKYSQGSTFLGIYHPTRHSSTRCVHGFRARAAAFFEDIARALPHGMREREHHDVYPRFENRELVASHILRERSRLLSIERKIKDNYRCQVCSFRFEERYGKNLGSEFAETHHIIPLSRLRGKVRTSLDDLRTVCANCHRMLHRMRGNRDDIRKLRSLMRRHRRSHL